MAALNDLAYEILMSMIIARTYKHSVFSLSNSFTSLDLICKEKYKQMKEGKLLGLILRLIQ
jgi:hypothetical protein